MPENNLMRAFTCINLYFNHVQSIRFMEWMWIMLRLRLSRKSLKIAPNNVASLESLSDGAKNVKPIS